MFSDRNKSVAQFWNTIVLDTWWPEAFAIAFSAACLVLVAIVLRFFDGRANPQFPTGITLNAIVSILATFSRSSLLFAVTATVGQAKWCWFRSRPRNLQDVQRLDEASRGPLGSVAMLFHQTVWSVTTLGALVIIFALGMEPSFQQLLAYRDITVLSERGSASAQIAIPAASNYSFSYGPDTVHTTLNAGVWAPPSVFDLEWNCPSGNCTWTPFVTLGICSRCENTTNQVSFRTTGTEAPCRFPNLPISSADPELSGNCTISPPQGAKYNFNFTAIYREETVGTDLDIPERVVWTGWSLIDYDDDPNVIERTYLNVTEPDLVLNHVQLRAAYNSDGSVTIDAENATQCVLSICATEYSLEVRNGKAEMNLTAQDFGSREAVSLLVADDTYVDDYCWNSPLSGNGSVCACKGMVWPTELGSTLEWEKPSIFWLQLDQYDDFWQSTSTDGPDYLIAVERNGFSYIIDNVAAAMTKLVIERSTSEQAAEYLETGIDSLVRGDTWVMQTVVRVRWEWFLLPAILLVVSIIFVLWTVLISHRNHVPLWKSSLLAVLFHGLNSMPVEQNRWGESHGYNQVSAMKACADVQYVQLESSEGRESSRIRLIHGKQED